MRKYGYIIGNICLLTLLFVLGGFSNKRFENSETTSIDITYQGESKRFMNDSVVNKLLIQNPRKSQGIAISKVDLNRLEKALYSYPYTAAAEVNLNIDKTLEVKIRQKSPLVRILSDSAFYMADDMSFVPLSPLFSARVPLVSGTIKKTDAKVLYEIAQELKSDEVLSKSITGINLKPNGYIELLPRVYEYKIVLGRGQNIKKKLIHLKSFLNYLEKHQLHQNYTTINLQYPNQLVCTKRNKNGT